MTVKKLLGSSKLPITIMLVGVIVFFSIASPAFLTVDNLLNVFRQVSMIGIAAIGVICVMLTGGIDLSISSMVTLVNITCAYLMVNAGMNPVLSCLICILMTTCIGVFNGVLVAYGKLMPLIATLCMQNILRGISYIASKGQPIFGFPESFKLLGQGYMAGIPLPAIIMVVIAILGAIFLNYTYIGRYFYCIGGNEEAARLSGINTKRVKILAYGLGGFFTGIAGVVWLSRVNSGQPTTGLGFEFDVVSGIVLGGVSVAGGEGDVPGAIMGVLVIGLLNNGLVLVNLSEYYQLLVKGMVLLLAISLDSFKRNYKGKRKVTSGEDKTPGQATA